MIVELFHFISSHHMKTAWSGSTGIVCVRFPSSQSHNAHHSVRAEVSSPLNLYFHFVIISTVPLFTTLFASNHTVLLDVASDDLSAISKVAIKPCEPMIYTIFPTDCADHVVFFAWTAINLAFCRLSSHSCSVPTNPLSTAIS